MKKVLLFSINVLIAFIIHAQTKPQIQTLKIFPDTAIGENKFPPLQYSFPDSLSNQLRLKRYYSDRTPPPGSMPKRFRYLGNNAKGFEVYQTYQDFMYLLKPDSNFVSNMPVLKMTVK